MPPSNLIFNMPGDDKYDAGERSKVRGQGLVCCMVSEEKLM